MDAPAKSEFEQKKLRTNLTKRKKASPGHPIHRPPIGAAPRCSRPSERPTVRPPMPSTSRRSSSRRRRCGASRPWCALGPPIEAVWCTCSQETCDLAESSFWQMFFANSSQPEPGLSGLRTPLSNSSPKAVLRTRKILLKWPCASYANSQMVFRTHKVLLKWPFANS